MDNIKIYNNNFFPEPKVALCMDLVYLAHTGSFTHADFIS